MNDNDPTPKKTAIVHVTHLEMTQPLRKHFPVPSKPRLAIMRAENIPAHFYRYLYDTIGRKHNWFLRRKMDDETLVNTINDDDVSVVILHADGCIAGFYELNLEELPRRVNLDYFGLMPEYQGLGLSKWFLSEAINAAWQHEPKVMGVTTDTLDHPAALSLYQKLGFSPVAIEDVSVEIWE